MDMTNPDVNKSDNRVMLDDGETGHSSKNDEKDVIKEIQELKNPNNSSIDKECDVNVTNAVAVGNIDSVDNVLKVPTIKQEPFSTMNNEEISNENKWSRNGFGESAPLNGKFSREETAQVRAAIEEYCAKKNLTPARLCSECNHKSEVKGAWMEIARRLPNRTVQSVYRHGVCQLQPFKRGPWTDIECLQLSEAVQEHGKKWSMIQKKLKRSADSCRDKYREMSFVKGRWTNEESELLQKIIRDQLKVGPYISMKELSACVEKKEITIPWSDISRKMGSR